MVHFDPTGDSGAERTVIVSTLFPNLGNPGRPVKGRPWEYCFYLDVRGSVNQGEVIETLDELNHSRVETRILGAYRSARVPSS